MEWSCDHCEAEAIGETELFDKEDILVQREICLCPECGDDFIFPLAS